MKSFFFLLLQNGVVTNLLDHRSALKDAMSHVSSRHYDALSMSIQNVFLKFSL